MNASIPRHELRQMKILVANCASSHAEDMLLVASIGAAVPTNTTWLTYAWSNVQSSC